MAYLVQQSAISRLTIGGVDYTNSLVLWQASDSTVNGSGLMTTRGSVELAQRPGLSEVSDYQRNDFTRGEVVNLYMKAGSGAEFKHPRGHLHVISATYEPQRESIIIEIGCRLALAEITDDIDNILDLFNANSNIVLDPARRNIQSISSGLAAQGKYMYEDNSGALVVGTFFNGDSFSGIATGAWVSVLGDTNLGVEPLNANSIIPDKIKLSYDVPVEEDPEEQEEESPLEVDPATGVTITEDTTISKYFFQYPASTWERTEFTDCLLVDAEGNQTPIACIEDGDSDAGGTTEAPASGEPETSGCGNTPEAPTDTNYDPDDEFADPYTKIPVTCNYGWQTVSSPTFVTATQTRKSRNEYGGVAQQQTRAYEEIRGPRVEANPQFFSDKHAFCTYLYGYACLPTGGCQLEGLDTILQGYSETLYEYDDDDGTLLRTTRDTFQTVLSAAKDFNWRSGILNGVAQDFNGDIGLRTDMYRVQRVVTEYLQQKTNYSEVLTTTYDSITSRGVGIANGSIDALDGIKTTQRRISTSVSTLPEQPDLLANPVTDTQTGETEGLLNAEEVDTTKSIIGGGYGFVDEAGPYVLEISLPVPAINSDGNVRQQVIEEYLDIAARWVKGDALGLQITEALRADICQTWVPGQPFRYADPSNNQIVGLRADAGAWAVNQEAAVVSFDGIWTGFSSGTLSSGDNLVGNATPNMSDGSPTPPPAPIGPPTIIDDQIGQSFYFKVDVHFWFEAKIPEFGNDNVLPIMEASYSFLKETCLTAFISGLIVGPGGLLTPSGSGSVLESDGQLVVDGATIINPNMFAAAP